MLTHKTTTALFGMLMLLMLCLNHFIFPLPEFIFILPVLGYFALVAWGSSQINSNYHLDVFCQSKDISNKHIALSFDDGPNETVTPLVLDWLKKHEISATFFLHW
jgi:peptidoglycan/xylan/chitin deacetylase (PgdA/CDA1 family)